jgi:hypothetical protein
MIIKKYRLIVETLLLLASLVMAEAVYAQTEAKIEIKAEEPKSESKNTDSTVATVTEKPKDDIRSIFFSNDELNNMAQIKLSCEKRRTNKNYQGLEEDDFLKKLENIANVKPTSPTFTYPQFFLSSIAYHSPADWVVWINGQKITPSTANNQSILKIIAINPNMVTFEWIPERMDKITDIGDSLPNNPIKVDMINNKVTFSLRGNQTFTTYAMKVVEGKVIPITINNSQDTQNTSNVKTEKPSQPTD